METSFFQSLITRQPCEEMSYKVQRPLPTALGVPVPGMRGPTWVPRGVPGVPRPRCLPCSPQNPPCCPQVGLPAGPSPPLTGAGGASTSAPRYTHPKTGLALPRGAGSLGAEALQATLMPPRIPLVQRGLHTVGPQICRVQGLQQPGRCGGVCSPPHGPARSVLFPAAPRGPRARRRRCSRAGCQGAAICPGSAARLGGGELGAPPKWGPQGCPSRCGTACGVLGRGPGPRGQEGSAGAWPLARLPLWGRGDKAPFGDRVGSEGCRPPRLCAPACVPSSHGTAGCLCRPYRNKGGSAGCGAGQRLARLCRTTGAVGDNLRAGG